MSDLLFAPPALGTVLSLTGLPGGSNKAHDRSPYGNHGTITGATWVRLPSGLWVLSFDGSDDCVNCGNGSNLDAVGAITLEAWIRPGLNFTTGVGYQILDKRNGGIAPTILWHPTRHLLIYAGDYVAEGKTASLSSGTWYHVVGIAIDGSASNKVYLNAVDDTNTTAVASFVTNTANLVLGATTDGTNWFNGCIALPRIYRGYVLTPFEIQNHFNQEKHLFGVW